MGALREHQAAWVELWLVHGEAGGAARPGHDQEWRRMRRCPGPAFGSLVITRGLLGQLTGLKSVA